MSTQFDAQRLARKVSFDPEYIQKFETKLFIEGPQTARRLSNFFTLLLLAAFIATYGLLSDSSATVIGAMIIAPLMGPIMATTAAAVMGQGRRALRALALVVAGIATVIAFSYALTLLIPELAISFTANGELASRINPGLLALFTALGSGAAGAFITSRDEIADSMGGVAIAISLVPPLCVVGIALRQGEWTAAVGALVLFATNFLAILLAGGVTFLIIGLGRVALSQEQVKVRRRGFALFVAGTVLVAIPLTITGAHTLTLAQENDTAATEVRQWLSGTSYDLMTVDVHDQVATVAVEGDGTLKPVKSLADRLAAALGHPVTVRLRLVPLESASSGQP